MISSSSCVMIRVTVYPVSGHHTLALNSSLVHYFILTLCFPPWLTSMVDFCSVIGPMIDVSASGLLIGPAIDVSASGLLSTPSTMVVVLSDWRALPFLTYKRHPSSLGLFCCGALPFVATELWYSRCISAALTFVTTEPVPCIVVESVLEHISYIKFHDRQVVPHVACAHWSIGH